MGNAEIHLYWPEEDFAVKREPQAKCGRAGSARRRGIVKGDKLSPLTNVLMRWYCNLREAGKLLFAILKTKKLQANCNLRKIHKQFGQRNSGEQHKGRQRSDSAEPDSGGFPRCKVLHEQFLGKTIFSVRQKGVPPLLLPASVLQLPRCLVRICNLFLMNHKIANW